LSSHQQDQALVAVELDAEVSYFSAVTYGNGKLSGLGEQLCLSEVRRQIANDELPLDQSLRTGVRAFGIL
jgi:hypothetical protein